MSKVDSTQQELKELRELRDVILHMYCVGKPPVKESVCKFLRRRGWVCMPSTYRGVWRRLGNSESFRFTREALHEELLKMADEATKQALKDRNDDKAE